VQVDRVAQGLDVRDQRARGVQRAQLLRADADTCRPQHRPMPASAQTHAGLSTDPCRPQHRASVPWKRRSLPRPACRGRRWAGWVAAGLQVACARARLGGGAPHLRAGLVAAVGLALAVVRAHEHLRAPLAAASACADCPTAPALCRVGATYTATPARWCPACMHAVQARSAAAIRGRRRESGRRTLTLTLGPVSGAVMNENVWL